ncbi:MAG: hypothetical protein OXT67_13280 [Zetaproteobacteria bacterium]|nr:hypothetical protein [Zetaproteobacteria bacterium]
MQQAFFIFVFAATLVSGCGKDSNLLGYIAQVDHKTQYDSLLALSKAQYDAGDYASAFQSAEQASNLFPSSVDANLMLGFAVLGKLGVSPFDMIDKLEAQNAESESESTSSSSEESESGEETSTSDTLGDFGNLLGFTEADFLLLGELETSDPELPVLVPDCPDTARQKSDKLAPVHLVISKMCPFVPTSLLIREDERQSCEKLPIIDQKKVKERLSSILFLWSFAHLVEAVSFHNVLTYKTKDEKFTNLEMRVNKIESVQVTSLNGVQELIESLNSTAALVGKVLDIDGNPDCGGNGTTQLQAVMFDLLAVGNGFSGIDGMPESVTAKLNASIAKIKSSQADINDTIAQSNSLQQDFSQKMATSVSNAITNASSVVTSPEQKDELCAAYSSISGQSNDTGGGAPELCQ